MNYIDLEKRYIFQTYKRVPVVFVKGKDSYLYDENGKKYLDMFSGISVSSVGYCNPKVISAAKKQMDNLIHLTNIYYSRPQVNLARMLSTSSIKGKVFFSNSGAEANECAIKLARKFGNKEGRYEIISFENSFHGRTIATLSATGQKQFHKGFAPLVKGFKFAIFNDISSVKKMYTKKTCAVIIEPVQGESGIYPADKKFLSELRNFCREKNILLIFDEIQCGLGRTGNLFAYKSYGVIPDIITLAKSLGGGLPIGATIAKKELSDIFDYGDHGSTFGGNPICCAAAEEVVKFVNNKKLLKKITENGKFFINGLKKLQKKYPLLIKEIRGIGYMAAAELYVEGAEIVNKCLEAGLLINCTKKKTLRFLPTLTAGKNELSKVLSILENVLGKN